jgi:hypothetical protein
MAAATVDREQLRALWTLRRYLGPLRAVKVHPYPTGRRPST